MKIKKWIGTTARQHGIALILVTGALALMTVLLLAMFSVTETEYKSTQGFVASQSAKQLGDVATAIVQAQIQNGQNATKGASRTIHATQPGAVRVYDSAGFKAAYKLYSSSQMAVTTTGPSGEASLTNPTSLPPADWDSAANKGRYVDLNEPVVRAPLSATTGVLPAVYYPVIDPRAAYNYVGSQAADGVEPAYGVATTKVEGFTYTKTIGASGVNVSGVVTPSAASGNPSLLRLPMPVEWAA